MPAAQHKNSKLDTQKTQKKSDAKVSATQSNAGATASKKRKIEEIQQRQKPAQHHTQQQQQPPAAKKQKFDASSADAADASDNGDAPAASAADLSISKQRKEQVKDKKRQKNPNFDVEVKIKQLLEQFRVLDKEQRKSKKKAAAKRKDAAAAADDDADDSDTEMTDLAVPNSASDFEEKKSKILDQILELLEGKGFDYAVKGDMSRVIQALLKNGNMDQRRTLYLREFRGKVVNLCRDIYGHHIVEALFTYICGHAESEMVEIRKQLFAELQGHVMSLLTKVHSAGVIDRIYSRVANKRERFLIVSEFYGRTITLGLYDSAAPASAATAEKAAEAAEGKSIAELCAGNPGRRLAVAKNLAKLVKKVLHKGLLDYLIIHQLLADIFEIGEKSDVNDVMSDLVDCNALPYILHTKNGCRAVMYWISYASAKMRKNMLRQLKEKAAISKAAADHYGVRVLIRFLDCMDDTKQSSGIFRSLLRGDEAEEDGDDAEMPADEAAEYARVMSLLSDMNSSKLFFHVLAPGHKSYFPNALDAELLRPVLRKSVITSHEAQAEMEKKELERKKAAFGEDYVPKPENDGDDDSDSDDDEEMPDAAKSETATVAAAAAGDDSYIDGDLMLVCKKPLLQKRREICAEMLPSVYSLIMNQPLKVLCDRWASQVLLESLKLSNVSLFSASASSESMLRELRNQALEKLIAEISKDQFALLSESLQASRTVSQLILDENSENAVSAAGTSDKRVSTLISAKLSASGVKKLVMSSASASALTYLIAALLKSGNTAVVAELRKQLVSEVPLMEQKCASITNKQEKKGWELLIVVLKDQQKQQQERKRR